MDAGVMQFKLCDNDFDCLSCEFDRAMTESATDNWPGGSWLGACGTEVKTVRGKPRCADTTGNAENTSS